MKIYLDHNNLRKLRIQLGLSQEYMADFFNKEQSTYNRLENGKIKLNLDHVPKISNAMQLNEEEILKALSGNTITTTNNENAQNNQNLVINIGTSENITKILEENNKIIRFLYEQIENLKNK